MVKPYLRRVLLAAVGLAGVLGAVGAPASAATILSLNFDGAIADAAGHSFTTFGNPTIDTSTSYAGSGSLRINANSASYLSFGPNADFDLGAQDFRLSMAFKIVGPVNPGGGLQYAGGLSQWGNHSSASYQLDVELTGGTATPRLNFWDVNGQHNMVGTAISLDEWHLVLLERVGSTISMYIDGELVNAFAVTGPLVTPLNALWIGEPECDGNVVCWTHDTTFYVDEIHLATGSSEPAPVPEPGTALLLGAGALALLWRRRISIVGGTLPSRNALHRSSRR